jgi:hypothetical protein
MVNENWEEIDRDFGGSYGEERQFFWKNHEFDCRQTKKWKEALGEKFEPRSSWAFCVWLRDEKHLTPQQIQQQQQGNLESLKTEYDKLWIDIYPGFAENYYGKNYQQRWEGQGLTYQNAKEWIPAGFKGLDYHQIKNWRNQGLNYQEAKLWIKLGFTPRDLWEVLEWKKEFTFEQAKELIELGFSPFDSEFAEKWKDSGFSLEKIKDWIKSGLNSQEINFANHLKQNNIRSSQLTTDELFQLRKEFYLGYPQAQSYSNKNYSQEQKNDIQELDFRNLNLEGDLDLEGFNNLKKIYLAGNPNLGKIKNKIGKCIYQNPQEWLNLKYPNKEEVKRIDLSESGLKEFEFEKSNELVIDNYPKLEWIVGDRVFDLTKLTISNCPQLRKVEAIWLGNQELILHNLPSLKWFDYSYGKLNTLDLTSCPNLEKIKCKHSHLTEIKLPIGGEKLRALDLSHNNFKQDLSFLSSLMNLDKLILNNNYFYGSLKPFKGLNELRQLNISSTDIDKGLEYLSENVQILPSTTDEIRPEARVSDIWEELQPYGYDLEKWREVKWDKKLSLVASPLTPPQFLGKIKQKSKFTEIAKQNLKQGREKHFLENIQDFKYDMIYLNQWGESNFPVPKNLPIRLYDIKGQQDSNTSSTEKLKQNVKETSQWEEKPKYATLSYLWGECKDRVNYDENGKFANLTHKGKIALNKAIKACELLGINYLWVDQLCINQDKSEEGREERGQEVPKMRQYYGNADVTLIAIDEKIGDLNGIDLIDVLGKIVNSEWFTRSWTFQEGWLSKHTIFMFDDKLIDGWAMAGTWALNQLGYTEEGKYNSRREFDKGSKKIATPVGWTYFRNGYNLEDNEKKGIKKDKVEMTLNQALKEIKYRGRGIPVDGIYSILGLLPYGEHVPVEYKDNLCKDCKKKETEQKQTVICEHSAKTEWPTYFKEDLEKALYEAMKVAYKNGYVEALAWHGLGTGLIPEIDENTGSTSVKGGIEIKKENFFQTEDIRLQAVTYRIQKVDSQIHKRESGFEVEGGLYEKKIWIKSIMEILNEEELEKNIEVVLLGTKEVMDLIEENKKNVVLAIASEGYQSNKRFGLLLKDTGEERKDRWEEYPIYHRLGLVELGAGSEKLGKEVELENIVISSSQNKLQQQPQILQTQPYGTPSSK